VNDKVISTDNHSKEPPRTGVDHVRSVPLSPRSPECIAKTTEGMSAETMRRLLGKIAIRADKLN